MTVFTMALTASMACPQKDWNQFKLKFGKNYPMVEDRQRFAIYQQNMQKINSHNQNHPSVVLAENQFTDWSDQEYNSILKHQVKLSNVKSKLMTYRQLHTLPEEIDWRKKNAVTQVKNQGSCGSCWAFSTTGSIEGAYAIKTGKLISLSEQQLVDCASQNNGCNGGLMDYAFQYVENNALEAEEEYSYDGSDESCAFNSSSKSNLWLKTYL